MDAQSQEETAISTQDDFKDSSLQLTAKIKTAQFLARIIYILTLFASVNIHPPPPKNRI